MKTFYVYILTNKNKNVLYIGYTKDLTRRLGDHLQRESSFSSMYKCFYLIYFEEYFDFNAAYSRERQLKKWKRSKKEWLIDRFNPNRLFLNDLFIDNGTEFKGMDKLNFEAIGIG